MKEKSCFCEIVKAKNKNNKVVLNSVKLIIENISVSKAIKKTVDNSKHI